MVELANEFSMVISHSMIFQYCKVVDKQDKFQLKNEKEGEQGLCARLSFFGSHFELFATTGRGHMFSIWIFCFRVAA